MVSATTTTTSGQWQQNNNLVSHQTEINAPIHVVWEELIDIKNWPSWNVWTRVDDEGDDSTFSSSSSSRTNDSNNNNNNNNSSSSSSKRLARQRSGRSRRRSGRIEEGVSGTMKLKLTTSSPKNKNGKWTKSTSFVFTEVSKHDHRISWTTTSPSASRSSSSSSSPSSPSQPPTVMNPLLSRVVVAATGGCKKKQPRRRVIHNIKLDSIDCKTTLLTHTKEIQGTGNGLLLGLPATFQKLVLAPKTGHGLGGGRRSRHFSCGIFSFDAMHRNCVLMDTELKYHVERIHFCSLVESISTRSFTMTDLGSSSISSCLGQPQVGGGCGGGGGGVGGGEGTEFGCNGGAFGASSSSKNVLLNPTTCETRALNNSAYWDTPKSIRNIIVSSYLQPSDHSSSSSSSDSTPVIGTVAVGE